METSKNSTDLTGLRLSAIVELATQVSARVQLLDVVFEEFYARRVERERFREESQSVEFNQRLAKVARDEPNLRFVISLEFEAIARPDSAPEDQSWMEARATLALTYSVSSFDDLSDVNLAAFAFINGVYNAWPYWREYVQSATVRLGLPPLIAPVYRIPADEDDLPVDDDGSSTE